MAGNVFLAFLIGFGLLSMLWCLLGWLLPDGRGGVLVCMDIPDEGILNRYRWLRSLGLLRCPLVAVCGDTLVTSPSDIEISSREDLLARLEQEWVICHGTGNGDPSGRDQRCGISEL